MMTRKAMNNKTKLSFIYTGCPKSREVLRNYMQGRGMKDKDKALKVLKKQAEATIA